ncbi:MAG: 16S rRNA (guanine(966)-N(2))-methyltransferase RsmD [Bacteroides sp.]|nr:16S rRNA (guanine(966)-N(2))-methyltransferase RsmD [Eubacterium sp.]MCM1417958.1 16S rRNA (guanine(966)-N(2))-methyltransferase RsmD [Roseburia sp.]MCM1461795.1 16S rRNA (guanine(966)-N(2))-methyltransferase RsmD [Bacteroides sp.]
MRVITGSAKGRRLKTAEGREVRPTAEKIKEAMFSMIQFELEGAVVLDLFAGSGQLGIEALSRGAKKAYFADNSAASIALVRDNLAHTGFTDRAEVCHMPNAAFLKGTAACFDVAFLDPPYEKNLIARSLPALTERMSESGVIVCEHERGCRLPEEENGFRIAKSRDHGKTGITVYRRIGETDGE